MPYRRPRRHLKRLQLAHHALLSATGRFHVLVLGLLLACTCLAAPVRAQERSVVVERRDAKITVLPGGDIRVVETWRPRFRGGPFRFAYFAIPLQRVDNIVNWSVAQDGHEYIAGDDEAPGTYTLEDDDGRRKLTWYFEPVTDQTREFRIAYTLRGALRIYPGGDQVFWKFVGDEWETPIEAARVTVTLPSDFEPRQLLTQTYLNGSAAAAGRIVDGSTVEFVGGPFQPGDEWELRAQFPHGAVNAAPSAWQLREERIAAWRPVWNTVSLAGSAVVLIGGLLGVYLLWYIRGRDRAGGMIAEYYTQPPDELPPGMAGTLLSESAGLRDVLATLVDLARRGYLQIVEHQGAGIRFVRLKTADNTLRPYERQLLKAVFNKHKERDLSDLKHTFSNKLGALREQLTATLIDEGYVTHNPQAVRTRYIMAGINGAFAIGMGGAIGWVLVIDYAPLAILVVIATVIVCIALAIAGNWMPRRTPQGATAVAKWRAFRRYLEHIDSYTEVSQAREQFERYLPYAIAFGLERSWVNTFAQHNTPVPTWYQPHGSSGQHSHADSNTDSQQEGGSNGKSSSAAPASTAPSLDTMASRGLGGLNALSAGFYSMLEQTSATISSTPAGSSSTGGFSGGGGSGFSGGGGGGGFG